MRAEGLAENHPSTALSHEVLVGVKCIIAYFALPLLLAGGLAAAACPAAAKKARPLSREEVATVWIGLSEDELYLLRLSLRADGTGQAAYVFVDSEAKVAPITAWSYDPGYEPRVWEWFGGKSSRIEITISGDSTFKKLEGTLGAEPSMTLRAAGPDWELRLVFRREQDLVPRWQHLRRSMEIPGSSQGTN